MQTHVKVVGVAFIVFGALGILAAMAIMLVFGGAAGIVGASADPEAVSYTHLTLPTNSRV